MLKIILNKLKEIYSQDRIQKKIICLYKRIRGNSVLQRIPDNYRYHIINFLIIICSYCICSCLIYPHFSFFGFIKEVFSLLFIYGAIFCWFTDKILENNLLKICLVVTACFAPIVFIVNSFGVAVVTLIFVIFVEYIIISYFRGNKLFSGNIPVYVICETAQDVENISDVFKKYKVLECVLLSSSEKNYKNICFSQLSSISDIEKHLRKINCLSFFPFPRRILYYSKSPISDNLEKLIDLSLEYSLRIFRITFPIGNNKEYKLSPVCYQGFRYKLLPNIDKSGLNGMFKGKNIWVCFDGRAAVKDFITILSNISIANLTVICDSEVLVGEIQRRLKKSNRNYHIKIADLFFMLENNTPPDFLFYNLPIKAMYMNDDHLKESLVKNVIDTEKLINLAYEFKIPNVYVFSSTKAINASNWVGATQRLGELSLQHADFYSRKNLSKFKIIRIPHNICDDFGIKKEITDSLLSDGYIHIDTAENELKKIFLEKDILSLLIKAVLFAYKSNQNAEVLTLIPSNEINIDNFIKNICSDFGLKKDIDVPVVYEHHNETMELDNFPNISESLEKTSLQNIFRTKFIASAVGSYNQPLSLEIISKMSAREIISAVFQSLSEKTNQKK